MNKKHLKFVHTSIFVAILISLLMLSSFCVPTQAQSVYPTTDGEPIFTLHLVYPNNNPARIRTAELIAEALPDIGIEVVKHEVTFFEWMLTLLPSMWGNPQPGPPGPYPGSGPSPGWDLGLIGWSLGMEPTWDLYQCGNPFNFMGYCNPDFDDLGLLQQTNFDPISRAEQLSQMQAIIHEDKPQSILSNPVDVVAMDERLTHYEGLVSSRPEVWEGLKKVTVASPVEFNDFNPLWSISYYDYLVIDPMFEGLYNYEANPDSPYFFEMVPQLAKHGFGEDDDDAEMQWSPPQLVPDVPGDITQGATLTVELAESVFADGHEVDKYDVCYTLQCNRDPRIDPFYDYYYVNDIGLTATPHPTENAVIFHFDNPPINYLNALSFQILPMHYWLPHKNAKQAATLYNAGDYPVLPSKEDAFNQGIDTFGSGPYQGRKGSLQFDPEKNEAQLWKHGGSHTKCQSVKQYTVKVESDRETAIAALKAGEVQLLDHTYSLGALRQELEAYPGLKVEFVVSNVMQVMPFNFNNVHLANRDVRVAIELVIDRQAIIDDPGVFDGLGMPTNTFIPIGYPFYDSRFGPGGEYKPRYDVVLARLLLYNAGYTTIIV